MTTIAFTRRARRRFASRLGHWLTLPVHRRPSIGLNSLSPYLQRDILAERDVQDPASIRSLHDAMRFSG